MTNTSFSLEQASGQMWLGYSCGGAWGEMTEVGILVHLEQGGRLPTMKRFCKDFVSRLPRLGASKEFLPFKSGPSLFLAALSEASSVYRI